MTEESAPNEMVVLVPNDMEGVRELMEQYTALTEREKAARVDEKQVINAVQALTARVIDPLIQEKLAIRAALQVYFTTNRKSVLAKFGRTIEFAEGTIKFRVIPKSLELPKDPKPIVQWLLHFRGAKKRYLHATYTLNKEALAHANQRLLSLLHALWPEFWAGRHEIVSFKPVGEEDPITIARRRYPERRH